MKRKTRLLALVILAGITTLQFTGCSSDDGGIVTEKPTEKPSEKATVQLTIEEVLDTKAYISLSATHTTSVYYYIIPATEAGKVPTVSESEIFDKGISVTEWNNLVEIQDLKPETTYYLFAAAKNSVGKVTVIEKAVEITTMKKLDVSIEFSAISVTNEQILFTITPTGAKKLKYKIVKSTEVPTIDDVLETGSNIMNLKNPTSLKPKGFDADTEYTIYAAALSNTDTKLMRKVKVRTKKADEAVNDGTIIFSTVEFTSELEEKAGQKIAYYNMTFKNTDWEAKFEIGALSTDANTIKEGKYTLPSKRDSGKPGPERIAENFVVRNSKTGAIVTDIDYGDITISKVNDAYKIVIDMVKLDIKNERFKASFQGKPTKK